MVLKQAQQWGKKPRTAHRIQNRKIKTSILELFAESIQSNLEFSDVQEWLVDNICEFLNTNGGALLLLKNGHAEHTIKRDKDQNANWEFIETFLFAPSCFLNLAFSSKDKI